MDDFKKFLNKTYNFLSFRPRSEKEIQDYLIKKKADSLIIKRVIESLKNSKFLDDKEFVKWWIEQRSRIKPKSLKFIKFELKQKGITKELIDEVLEAEDFETVPDLDKAMDLAKRRILRYKNEEPRKKWEKMSRFLASKGFDYDTIKQVIDQILPKGYNN